jgi:DNA-binding transcriptional MerR regulator
MSRATLQETLEKYEISPTELLEWEEALGLNIPVGTQGNKLYTRQHINLFKNVKKHLALGRSLEHIKRIISLPPAGVSKEVSTDVKAAWGHVPKLTKHATTSPVMEQPAPPAVTPIEAPKTSNLSLQSDALLESFKHDADELTQQVQEDESLSVNGMMAEVENDASTVDRASIETVSVIEAASTDSGNTLVQKVATHTTPVQAPRIDSIAARPEAPSLQAEDVSVIEAIQQPIAPQANETPSVRVPESLQQPQGMQASTLPVPTAAVALHTLHEPSPVHHLSVPMAQASSTTSESLQIVDRLITEKDVLQQRVVEAEKLNSHLYNINGLFNKKVKELTQLVNTLKKNYNEEDMMKLMSDKSRLQKELLEAERTKIEALRRSDAMRQEVQLANQASDTLKQELYASRAGFEAKRFMGNWKEALVLQEIQFDTFGLNVEPTREQHRLIDVTPTRVIGNVAFITTRYAYPDNDLWQRHETLTLIMLEEHHAKGELQVDYILDGVTVCRAIYTASLERIS